MSEQSNGTSVARYRLRRRFRALCAVVTALLVSWAFVSMTMARNNYSQWKWDFFGWEAVVALAGALGSYALVGVERSGLAWADAYLSAAPSGRGTQVLHMLLANLVPAGVSAVLITGALSVLNVAYAPSAFFFETVKPELVPMGILMRLLADLPACLFICLLVRLAGVLLSRKV